MHTAAAAVTGDPSHRTVSGRHHPVCVTSTAESSSSRSRNSSSPAQSRHRIVSVPHHYFSRHRLIVVQGNPG
jgi:hypothetical protein